MTILFYFIVIRGNGPVPPIPIKELAEKGLKNLVVVPISFVSDILRP
jgi:hypothetical protein